MLLIQYLGGKNKQQMKKIIKIYFWTGVNVIGLPELCIHDTKCLEEKSRFFGSKKTLIVEQKIELL